MDIAVKNCQRSIKVNQAQARRIQRIVASALKHLASGKRIEGLNLAKGSSFEPSDATVSILLIGDKRMREMNRDYRGKDKTTDVLSFSQLEGFSLHGTAELGDIVISLPQARRQAAERGASLEQEVTVLLIHGLLHLIGYDHEKNEYQHRKMKQKEKELLDAVKKMGQ